MAPPRRSRGWTVGVRYLLAGLSAGLLCACAAQPLEPAGSALQPFTTDGCSMFPDRSLMGRADWCGCCLAHDLKYWRGGTSDERLAADQQLRTCVAQVTGDTALADLMYAGVRSGGGPYFYTPYRWAYGWPFGRNYEPLSEAERARADELQAQYQARNPALTCPE